MKPLTERQQEAVILMCDGAIDRVIAVSLFITPSTVAKRIQGAMRNYGVESRAELIYRLGFEAGKKAVEIPTMPDLFMEEVKS